MATPLKKILREWTSNGIPHAKPNNTTSRSHSWTIWPVLGQPCWDHMVGLGQRSVLAAPLHSTPYGRYMWNLLRQGVPTSQHVTQLMTYCREWINQQCFKDVITGSTCNSNLITLFKQAWTWIYKKYYNKRKLGLSRLISSLDGEKSGVFPFQFCSDGGVTRGKGRLNLQT